jgi:hypothetical protein
MRIKVFLTVAITLGSLWHDATAQCFQFRVVKSAATVKEVPLKRGKCPAGTIAKSKLTGAAGADAPSIYGDGSAGAFDNSISMTLSVSNPQFTSFTNSGTLSIPSGTVIRVQGNFVNQGTINVTKAATPGYINVSGTTGALIAKQQSPGSGLASGPAGNAEFGADGSDRLGGRGGYGFQPELARNLFRPGLYGGGGGGSCVDNGIGYGGAYGGGSIVFLVEGTFVNDTGTINAPGGSGATGGGGGGGGIIIVGSKTSISSAGTMNASGGDGGSGGLDTVCAPGGGGGGGMIKFVSPIITSVGTRNVAGGSGGPSITTSNVVISGGGGGGGSLADGGSGATAKDSGLSGAGSAGTAGGTYSVVADPGALFR